MNQLICFESDDDDTAIDAAKQLARKLGRHAAWAGQKVLLRNEADEIIAIIEIRRLHS